MTEVPYLWIKNFERFQHYKDRNPPWIKLYTALLSDPEFLKLPEAAQAQLIKLWLLAAQMGNPLPNDPRLLRGKIWCTGRLYLADLIVAGWLKPGEFASADASNSGANASSGASKDAQPGASTSRARTRVRAQARELEGEREPEELPRDPSSSGFNTPQKKRSSSAASDKPSPELKAAVRALPSAARDFLGTFWPQDSTPAAVRIEKAREIVATLNGGATFKGNRVHSLSPDRLSSKCREVLADPPRDRPKAMAVLLVKLADVGNAQDSPTERLAREDRDTDRVDATQVQHAFAWLDANPDREAAIDAEVDREMPDAASPFRSVYRMGVVARAWREAGAPIVQPAGRS